MNPDWRTRYELAIDAARQAGDLAKTIFDGTFDVEFKADQSPVTIADRNAEALIRKMVGQHFPGDGFLGDDEMVLAARHGAERPLDCLRALCGGAEHRGPLVEPPDVPRAGHVLLFQKIGQADHFRCGRGRRRRDGLYFIDPNFDRFGHSRPLEPV